MSLVRAGRAARVVLGRSSALAVAALAGATAFGRCAAQEAPGPVVVPAETRAAVDRLIDAAVQDTFAYRRLGELVDGFGSRLTGSESLERALDWALAQMKKDGLENVRGEEAIAPHWVRGAESAELVKPRALKLPMLGLGRSVGTPPGGITAEVLVVSSFDELDRRAAEARGKIVLFDVPFVSYGRTVQYRSDGAIRAARVGAVASLIRSITPFSIRSPHTGALRYDSTVKAIPAAALTVEDAMMLHRMQDRGQHPVVRLVMSAQMLPPMRSRNAVAEIRGTEKPDEVVVVSGHMDSWDVGQGAMDDGGGAVAAWEAVRLMKQLGLRPKRTVRVVLWTNEEYGTAGGRAYAQAHAAELSKHILAIESDAGVFKPLGFDYGGSNAALPKVRAVATLLDRIGAGRVETGGGETDIEPMMRQGVPGMGLDVDGTRYFWYHHTEADTLDKLDPHEMALCVAAMAAMAYGVADLP